MTSFDAFGETGRFECKRLDPGARLRCRAENRIGSAAKVSAAALDAA